MARASCSATVAQVAAAVQQQSGGSSVRESGGGQVLAGDLRIAFLVINEGRHKLLHSVFGCTRQEANLVTLIGAGMVAHSVNRRLRRLISGPMPPPGDNMLAVVGVRELLTATAGPGVRDTPGQPDLLLLAILASGGAPVLVKSLRGLRRAGHNLDSGFRHRYGYLVDVGHRRARHYQKRAQEALAARIGDEGQE